MNPKHHDGREETPATTPVGADQNQQNNHVVFGDLEVVAVHHSEPVAESTQPPLLYQQNEASQSFTRQIGEELVVSTEFNHGDLDHTNADTSEGFDGWINLPEDICNLILDLLGAFDILSFPLVCKPWAGAYAKNRRLQPGAPTLLTSPSYDGRETPDDYRRGSFSITNILSSKVFSVEVEGLRYGRWIGGKDEWLVISSVGARCVQLLNPATRRCIALPEYMPGLFDRVQLCRTPSESDGYFAISISFYKLTYTTEGCDHWITLKNPNAYWLSYYDAIMHRGKIFAICENGDLWLWDLDQEGEHPKLLMSSSVETEGWGQFDFTLAPSLGDNILIVSPYGEDIPVIEGHSAPSHSNRWNFLMHGAVLHEVDTDGRSIEEVRDIGDWALFLGPNYPFYLPVSVPKGGLNKNYFNIAALSDHDVVAIDLSLEDVPGNVYLIDFAWLINNPHQVPMWFCPAFP